MLVIRPPAKVVALANNADTVSVSTFLIILIFNLVECAKIQKNCVIIENSMKKLLKRLLFFVLLQIE